jgi:hypothetical protein
VRLRWVREMLSETSEAGEGDLATQFEAMLDVVWKAEADWRLSDRIDLAVGLDAGRP